MRFLNTIFMKFMKILDFLQGCAMAGRKTQAPPRGRKRRTMTGNMTRAIVTENGESPYAVTIKVSGHEIRGDEPASFGGGDTGPAPYDLLTAALGACTAITVRWYADQHNWPLEEVEVRMAFRKEEAAGQERPVDVFEKRVRLRGPDLTDAQRQRLLEVAAKCPVQRSLEGTPRITTLLD